MTSQEVIPSCVFAGAHPEPGAFLVQLGSQFSEQALMCTVFRNTGIT